MRIIGITLIKGYQYFISPLFSPCCRFYPSCSEYLIEAMQVHGFLRGVFKGIKRLSKCHPFNPGGYDPVD
ncbi:membrane protein insertion efficiency factor YidD [bacterium]|nr:membrane protein insertion efficiency factor YidD [bacterium]